MTLFVKPLKGYLTHDTNIFTSMDPYCYLYLGKQTQKTSPHYGGGIRPSWKETMRFKIENITKLGIEIWAKALIGADTLVGQGIIDLRKLNLTKGQPIQQYVDIQFENKAAGRVLLQIQFVNAKNIHPKVVETPIQNNIKQKNNGWDMQRKPERNSWAGDINWRGSNITENVLPPQPQSAIRLHNEKQTNKNFNNASSQNLYGFNEIQKGNFKKKPADNKEQLKQKFKTEQQKVNQYLNNQILKNFAPRQSDISGNINNPNQKEVNQHKNIHSQQALYEQGLQQQKLQQQMMQQYQYKNPFQNHNYTKPNTALVEGTIYAHPDKNYNPYKKSNVGRNSNVGIGTTPPKSILTPPKLNRPKSPGKKVHFADQ